MATIHTKVTRMEAFTTPVTVSHQSKRRRAATSPRRRPRSSPVRPVACAESPNEKALLETLRSNDQPKQVLTLISLERLPGTQAVSLIHESGALDSPRRQVRIAALATLGKLGVHQEVDTLVSVLLHDDDHSIRAAAANGLGHLFEPEIRENDLKDKAVQALKQAATKDEHFIVRYAAIVSVGNLGEPSSVEVLLPIATNIMSPALEAAAAVTALGEVVGVQDVDETLLEAISARADDREDFVRAAVARTLGRWGDAGDAWASLERMRVNEEKYGQSSFVKAILGDVFGSEGP